MTPPTTAVYVTAGRGVLACILIYAYCTYIRERLAEAVLHWFADFSSLYPTPGTVVWIRAYLLFQHKGIVSDCSYYGKPMIITNDPIHGVIEQTWDAFAAEQIVQIEGYPSRLPHHEVVRRARSRIGARYRLFDFNCDHLKNYAHALPELSEQVQAVMQTAVIGIAAAIAARKP
jgi:hypothetical protein